MRWCFSKKSGFENVMCPNVTISNKSLKGQSALKKGRREAMFDFI
jgi:hypothetical protein